MGKVGLRFQCGACLALTPIMFKNPTWLTPSRINGTCGDCGSLSDLMINKTKDGLNVKTLEVRLTYAGREAYYLLNPEKDPDYVYQDGNQNNHDVIEAWTNESSADNTKDLQEPIKAEVIQENSVNTDQKT